MWSLWILEGKASHESKLTLHPLNSHLKCEVNQQLTWPQFKCQKFLKGCWGVTTLGWRLECSALPPLNPSGLVPSCFSDKEAEQLRSQSCNTYLHTWMAHSPWSQPQGSCHCIGGSFTKFLLQSKDTNSKVQFTSFGFTFWKVHIQNTSFLDSHLWHTCLCEVGDCIGQWKRIRLPKDSHLHGDLHWLNYWHGLKMMQLSWTEHQSRHSCSLTDFS